MADRKLDDLTLAVFGDHDSGYGHTYAEAAEAEPDLLEYDLTHKDQSWREFGFVTKRKLRAK